MPEVLEDFREPAIEVAMFGAVLCSYITTFRYAINRMADWMSVTI